MKNSINNKIIAKLEKLKFRFSYFLIVGIIGVCFQALSYVLFNSQNITTGKIVTSKMSSQFVNYVMPTWFNIFSPLLIMFMAIGFIICSRKESLLVKIGAYVLGISQLCLSINSIITLSYCYSHRKKLFSNTTNPFIYTVSSIKLICVLVTFVSIVILAVGMRKAKEQDGLGKTGIVIGELSCGLFSLFTFVSLIVSSFNNVLNSYYKYYPINGSFPYEKVYNGINGFSLATLNRLVTLSSEAQSFNDSGMNAFAIYGVIYQIIYLVALVGTAIFITTMIIQSYDLMKDDDPLSL